jgi:phosphopantetheinyl transferase (holo-ACP synthase)/acyl carrier protein
MSAFGSIERDPSVTGAIPPAASPLDVWAASNGAVCWRLDGFPCEPGLLADEILSSGERAQWLTMRGVEKRRREWLLGRCAAKEAVRRLLESRLDLRLSRAAIEVVPDAYGCPQVRISDAGEMTKNEGLPHVSIAHSDGTAIALAALNSNVGVDLESVARRREDFESVAFSREERGLAAALPPEWALRMWCAKEAVGKALGRGLSAGLLAFRITNADAASGFIKVEFGGKSCGVYTARESNFVFSAMIYQQGAVLMRPSRQEILDYLLQKLGELAQDWDYTDPIGPESLLFTELGYGSLEAVVLCTAIQEHYQTPMPFAELLAEIGQQQRDLSLNELTDFVDTHLPGSAGADSGARRIQ